MPQDVPLEASETLVFTPECLTGLESPPKFTLRAATTREKRWMRRLIQEEGAVQYSVEQMRAEMLKALKPLWGDDAYPENAQKLQAYWEASDEFVLQKKADPDLEWSYDPEVEAAVEKLERDVAQAWRPFAEMRAANAFASEISMLAVVAVVLIGWSGLRIEPARDRGYLTIDSVADLKEVLVEYDEQANATRHLAWAQLLSACSKRMFLSEDEEKNSASPSPSETPPQNSKPGKAEKDGASPASASSTKTPAGS